MRFFLLICAMCAFVFSGAQEKNFFFLPGSYSLNSAALHGADPDLPSIRFAKTGTRWNNMIGASLPLAGFNHKNRFYLLSGSGFAHLYEFNTESGYPVQMIRTALSLNGRFNVLNFNIGRKWQNTVFLNLGYGHESNLVTDYQAFFKQITVPLALDNDSTGKYIRRSFEYLEIKPTLLTYFKRKWGFSCGIRYRYFPKPLNSNQQRTLTNALAIDVAGHLAIYEGWHAYVAVFTETISNNFVSDPSIYRIQHNKENFTYFNAEVGVRYKTNDKRQVDFFVSRNDGSGRGMDFLLTYKKQWGTGIRLVL